MEKYTSKEAIPEFIDINYRHINKDQAGKRSKLARHYNQRKVEVLHALIL